MIKWLRGCYLLLLPDILLVIYLRGCYVVLLPDVLLVIYKL